MKLHIEKGRTILCSSSFRKVDHPMLTIKCVCVCVCVFVSHISGHDCTGPCEKPWIQIHPLLGL